MLGSAPSSVPWWPADSDDGPGALRTPSQPRPSGPVASRVAAKAESGSEGQARATLMVTAPPPWEEGVVTLCDSGLGKGPVPESLDLSPVGCMGPRLPLYRLCPSRVTPTKKMTTLCPPRVCRAEGVASSSSVLSTALSFWQEAFPYLLLTTALIWTFSAGCTGGCSPWRPCCSHVGAWAALLGYI